MKANFRTVFWSAAAVAIAVLLGLAFRPRPVAVDVAQTTRGALTVVVRDEGRTRVRNEYVVSSPVAGLLLRVAHKPGDHVHAGQTLAQVLPADPVLLDARTRAELQAVLRSAEAALAGAEEDGERAAAEVRYAQTDAERLEQVHALGLAAQEALDLARLRLRVAESAFAAARESVRMRGAEVEAARARLLGPGTRAGDAAAVEVRAPVSGRVMRVIRESQAVVAAGDEIMMLGDPREIEVVAELLSTDAVQVRPGAAAFIENWGRDAAPLRGRVRLVEPYGFLKISALGVEEQRVNVIVDFTDAPEQWSTLGHGYRVEAAVVTWEADDVIRAPVAALFRSGAQWAVFRVDAGRARLTPVEVGHDDGRDAEILSGIEPGQTVVLYPGEQLRDGARVVQRQ